MNNKCQCGRGKYPDADSCEKCYKKGAAYERGGNDSNYCSCGNGKIADADCCEDCYYRNSAYGDR